MQPTLPGLIATGLLAAGVPAFAADLSVEFVHPEQYVDAAYFHAVANDKDREQVQRDIERHLQRLAERYLADGDSLKIEVLAIDLAGRFEPFRFRFGTDVRIVRDVTWPRIKLRYSLSHADRVVAGGEEQLSDMDFQMSANRYPSSDRLRYEKSMLDEWFRRRIARVD